MELDGGAQAGRTTADDDAAVTVNGHPIPADVDRLGWRSLGQQPEHHDVSQGIKMVWGTLTVMAPFQSFSSISKSVPAGRSRSVDIQPGRRPAQCGGFIWPKAAAHLGRNGVSSRVVPSPRPRGVGLEALDTSGTVLQDMSNVSSTGARRRSCS